MIPQTNPGHCEEETQSTKSHKTPGRKSKVPHQDDGKTRKDTEYCITKQGHRKNCLPAHNANFFGKPSLNRD